MATRQARRIRPARLAARIQQRLHGADPWRLRQLRRDPLDVVHVRRRHRHHPRAARFQQGGQAGLRMTPVQRKVCATRVERSENQAQQRQPAVGIERNHAARTRACRAQAGAEPSGALIQLGIGDPGAGATRRHALAVQARLLPEQAGIAAAQRIRMDLPFALDQQLPAHLRRHHRDRMQRALRVARQLEQNVSHGRKQAIDIRMLKHLCVIRQLQHQFFTRHHHHGDRIVGVGSVAFETDLQVGRPSRHIDIDRRVLEHEDAVEQIAPARGVGQRLDLDQRHMLVLAHLQVLREQRPQPLPDLRVGGGQPGTQGDGVDEETDGLLDALQLQRPTSHRHAKQDLAPAAQPGQQQRPRGLHHRIHSHLFPLRLLLDRGRLARRQARDAIAHPRHARRHGRLALMGQRRDRVEAAQGVLPVLARPPGVLPLQPPDEITIGPRLRDLRRAAPAFAFVVRKEVPQQQRAAPGIHQNVMKALNHVERLRPRLDQA
ncbi:hypothetical protein D3C85_760880 [compost metagenome]